jgi:hypothetical protein
MALWLIRGVSSGVLFVVHCGLLFRARGTKSSPMRWVLPSVVRWQAGERVGPTLWWFCLGVYGIATVASGTQH